MFVKTHDFLLWLIQHTQRFPKNLRHTFTQRLETALLDFQEATLMGNAARGPQRTRWLDGRHSTAASPRQDDAGALHGSLAFSRTRARPRRPAASAGSYPTIQPSHAPPAVAILSE
ncbi:MAG: four helix bundle protein [Pirellulales bacterium]